MDTNFSLNGCTHRPLDGLRVGSSPRDAMSTTSQYLTELKYKETRKALDAILVAVGISAVLIVNVTYVGACLTS